MTSLEFDIDEGALAKDLEFSPETASPAALEETYFEMPVRFSANGVQLLEVRGSSSPISLPLLSLASYGREQISALTRDVSWTYELPGGWRLHFVRQADDVTIQSDVNQTKVSVPYAELKAAWDRFSQDVRAFLERRVPKLQKHPMWDTWMPR
jgi:hypothetical protein